MDINDLRQETSRKIAEKIIENLKLAEDGGAGITGEFVFCFEKDDDYVRTRIRASSTTLLHLMNEIFKTLQDDSPVAAYLAEGILKGAFSQKNKKSALASGHSQRARKQINFAISIPQM